MSFYFNINTMKHLIILALLVISSGSWASVISQVADSSSKLVKVYVKQDPATYKKEKGDAGLVLEFAVQLSASSRPIMDKSTLKSWEELGPLYIHEENGMYKVRLGPFDTQDKAKEVLLQAKQRGKKDAFIVIQKGLENYQQPEGFVKQEALPTTAEPAQPVSPAPAPVVSATTVTPATPITSTDEIIEYKVRLASYLKPGGFSTKDVDQYGPLESYRKGEWTILMIGGFKTEQEASKVRDQVIAKGFKDAAVVVSRDGMINLEH
jgi:sporulation related protein